MEKPSVYHHTIKCNCGAVIERDIPIREGETKTVTVKCPACGAVKKIQVNAAA